MTLAEILLLTATLAASALLAAPLPRAARWLQHAVAAVVVVAAAQSARDPRWQMVPAYALAGGLLGVWLWRTVASPVETTPRRPARRLAAGLLGFAAAVVLPVSFPPFRFPPPGGPHVIGTRTVHWVDADRPEAFAADPDARRELMVQIWYPARAGASSPRAPYVEDAPALAAALARLHGIPARVFSDLGRIATNAVASAPVSDAERAYPVLVFLEGITGVRQMNTFQVEELASRGYVVVAVDQPYTAAVVLFPDGRSVAGLSKAEADPIIQQSLRPARRAPRLRGRPLPAGIVPALARDVSFVLDRLALLNRAQGPFGGRLDLGRAGVFGVSLGGIVAGEACRAEPRLRACLVLDAPMPARVVADGLRQPTMWVSRDAGTMQREGWAKSDIDQHQTTMRAVFERLPGDGYIVRVRGMYHADLTDAPVWSALVSRLGLTGPVGTRRAHRLVNAYSVAFFDRHLRGRAPALLDRAARPPPGVLVETRRPWAAPAAGPVRGGRPPPERP